VSDFIPVNEPLLQGNEALYLSECVQTGWVSSQGPFVARFEQEMATRLSRKHAIAVSSGTSALEAAMVALDLGPGDEVIMPSFTMVACAAGVVRCGATPVLVDAHSDTWNMNVEAVEAAITSQTRAIMAVHIYGLPVDMAPLLELAAKHKLAVIEDAAEALGQSYFDSPCGSMGDLSILSFYPNKHITTGEGGMILTDDDALATRCRSLRDQCYLPEKRFVHEELGWNMRMSNLQAAVGVAQLEQLDRFLSLKRRMGRKYNNELTGLPMQLPVAQRPYAQNLYWVFGVVLFSEKETTDAMAALKAQGIGTRPFFWPMHEQPVFKKRGLFAEATLPVSEHLARHGFYLPSGLALTNTQQERVISVLRALF